MCKYIKKKMFKPLHLLNNLRFDYILKKNKFKNKSILDLGCGIGMLSEKLSLHGGVVTGIDKSSSLIKIALENARKKKLSIKYLCSNFLSVENFNFKFDIIICTEVIEHLDDIFNFFIFLDKVSKKNTIIFISSLNKNLISYFKIILLGEFFSGTLVKNTHNIDSF
ncbi:MAG TPA: bifunctional 2-polyprenyl-6-hydroxyphenol methylase/3-demethylubiquinol 3-O-methyltransferase UbiG [Candidatus Azoamicus sp.]